MRDSGTLIAQDSAGSIARSRMTRRADFSFLLFIRNDLLSFLYAN
jgi:hypothetical protein